MRFRVHIYRKVRSPPFRLANCPVGHHRNDVFNHAADRRKIEQKSRWKRYIERLPELSNELDRTQRVQPGLHEWRFGCEHRPLGFVEEPGN
jgi:hypothetical protein